MECFFGTTILPRSARTLPLLMSILACTSCSQSTSSPRESIGAARVAIEDAERAEAGTYAPAELKTARDKMTQGQEALADGKNTIARRYAEQAEVDAALARETAALARASKNRAQAKSALTDFVGEAYR